MKMTGAAPTDRSAGERIFSADVESQDVGSGGARWVSAQNVASLQVGKRSPKNGADAGSVSAVS